MPNGATSTAPAVIASASPVPPGNSAPVRWESTMYAAQSTPAASAKATPAASSEPPEESARPRMPAGARVAAGAESAARRKRPPHQVERPPRARDRHSERPDELERHRHPERDPV